METATLRRLAIRRGYICPRCTARRGSVQPFSQRGLHSSPARQGVLEELEQRGLVNQIAGNRDALSDLLSNKRASIYAGIDPTAPSLHLGHLLPLMVLFWLHNHGCNVVSLVGGATARVGDPSGRLTSRAKVDGEEQRKNFRKMWTQTAALWKSAEAYGKRHGYRGSGGKMEMLNNATWLDKLNVLDFLRVLGNGMRVGTMLGRDTVRNKMEKGDGMSFSEFTYPLLQGWDWWHMYETHRVQVQVGGSDQYGNIVAGMDAVRFIAQNEGYGALEGRDGTKEPMGLTVPLLTTSSGEKFGKSAGNAIWLDLRMTSSFDLYGFLLKTADDDVERYLKLFTFIPLSTISEVMAEHTQNAGKRVPQHFLAAEVIELVHGPKEAERAKKKHADMRKPTLRSIASVERRGRPKKILTKVLETTAEAASSEDVQTKEPEVEPEEEEHGLTEQHIVLSSAKVLSQPFATVLMNAGLASSKSKATRMINAGGVYVARRVGEFEGSEELEFVSLKKLAEAGVGVKELLIDERLVLRLGKWKVRVIEVMDEDVFEGNLFRV